jgi:6-phosphogluconolactonase
MTLPVAVADDAAGAVLRVAGVITERARAAVEDRGAFTLALSRSEELAARLGEADMPWAHVTVFQVDERVVPFGHEDRNLTQLLAALPPDAVRPLPVDDPDLDAAADRYAAALLEPLDLVHLGLGADGHTASLVPGDPVLELHDRLVAVTREHKGYRRMTLTYPALEAAGEIVWLVTGESKRDALSRLLAGDVSIPAARVRNDRQRVVIDHAVDPRRPPTA